MGDIEEDTKKEIDLESGDAGVGKSVKKRRKFLRKPTRKELIIGAITTLGTILTVVLGFRDIISDILSNQKISFTSSQNEIYVGDSVSFRNTSNFIDDYTPKLWRWYTTLGDKVVDQSDSGDFKLWVVQFKTPGKYEVHLEFDIRRSSEEFIVKESNKIKGALIIAPESGVINEEIEFVGNRNVDSLEWSFPGGFTDITLLKSYTAKVLYSTANTYEIVLTYWKNSERNQEITSIVIKNPGNLNVIEVDNQIETIIIEDSDASEKEQIEMSQQFIELFREYIANQDDIKRLKEIRSLVFDSICYSGTIINNKPIEDFMNEQFISPYDGFEVTNVSYDVSRKRIKRIDIINRK